MNDDIFDWGTEDRFRSNYGRGPLTARILCVTDGRVHMERTCRKGGAFRVRFSLPVWFFQRPSCGWRRIKAVQL